METDCLHYAGISKKGHGFSSSSSSSSRALRIPMETDCLHYAGISKKGSAPGATRANFATRSATTTSRVGAATPNADGSMQIDSLFWSKTEVQDQGDAFCGNSGLGHACWCGFSGNAAHYSFWLLRGLKFTKQVSLESSKRTSLAIGQAASL